MSSPEMNRKRVIRFLFGFVVFCVIWGAASILFYSIWTHDAFHTDFFPRWAGMQELFSGNRDLYSEMTTRALQIRMYGKPLPPQVDQQGFAYPAILVVFLFPFGLIPDMRIASALWEGLSIIILVASLLLVRKSYPVNIPIIILILGVFWGYSLMMVFNGQFTVFPFFAFALGMAGYLERRDWISGAGLSIGLVKPELMLVPIIFFFLFAIRERRFKIVGGFLLAAFTAFAVSVLFVGWWIPGWINAVVRYAGYAKPQWPIMELFVQSPWLLVGLIIFLAGSLSCIWKDKKDLLMASIPLGMLLLPQTLLYSNTMLVIPMFAAWQSKSRWGGILIWIFGWLWLASPISISTWRAQGILLPILVMLLLVFAAITSPQQEEKERKI
jgi:hypothetical protein